MKILHTTEFYYPSVGGVQEAVRQLSERLAALGHEVTVATTKLPDRKFHHLCGVKIVDFNISGNRIRGIRGEKQKYIDYVLDSKFDVVVNFAAQQWTTDLLLPLLGKIQARKVFVPTGFSQLHSPLYASYFKEMRAWMREYDMNIFLSGNYRDINFTRKNNIRRIKVIPNGASKKEFLPKPKINIRKILGIPDDHFLVLDVGSHTGLKGHSEAIRIFCKAGIENATFLLIGKKTKSIRGCFNRCRLMKSVSGKNILLKDLTREETVAAFKSADIFLFTSKVECSPIVLFESIAAKTPFLTTDVGNAKEIIGWTKGGILLPTRINKSGYSLALINESAKILKECYKNRNKLSLMARAGHAAWLERFTWEKITKEYERVYLSLLKA